MPPFEEFTSKFYLLWIRMLDELLRYANGYLDHTSAKNTQSYITIHCASPIFLTISSAIFIKNFPFTIMPCLIKFTPFNPHTL